MKFIAIIGGLLIGLFSGYIIIKNLHGLTATTKSNVIVPIIEKIEHHQVIGFLPYWLLDKADHDYSKYITTLTYFGLTIDTDGSVQKYTKPGEAEPGWYALHSGKVDTFLESAKNKHLQRSLLVFNADEASISAILSDPIPHARNLINDVEPIMKEYDFRDLNLDIESVIVASEEARLNFTAFTKELKKNLQQKNLGTLTVDASPIVLVKKYLIDLNDVGKIADFIVLMTYDYHYPGSIVTGPVSPIGGVTEGDAEFDSETAIKEAVRIMPTSKIFLGAPLYGYEWETLNPDPRSPVIRGTGVIASSSRAEKLLQSCKICELKTDNAAKESYITYYDEETETYHQIFFPQKNATQEKVTLADRYNLEGIALWALGYEEESILSPLESYKEP